MSPEEIEQIVNVTISENGFVPWWAYLLFLVLPFIGAYLGSYAKKKGENLATKEDFKILLDQVKETTKETENIKSDIAKVSWVDEKRWLLKEKYYTLLLDGLYKQKEAFFHLSDFYAEPGSEYIEIPKDNEFYNSLRKQCSESSRSIAAVRGVSGVALSEDALKALDKLAASWYMASIDSACDKEFFTARLEAADNAYSIILREAINELGTKSHT